MHPVRSALAGKCADRQGPQRLSHSGGANGRSIRCVNAGSRSAAIGRTLPCPVSNRAKLARLDEVGRRTIRRRSTQRYPVEVTEEQRDASSKS